MRASPQKAVSELGVIVQVVGFSSPAVVAACLPCSWGCCVGSLGGLSGGREGVGSQLPASWRLTPLWGRADGCHGVPAKGLKLVSFWGVPWPLVLSNSWGHMAQASSLCPSACPGPLVL